MTPVGPEQPPPHVPESERVIASAVAIGALDPVGSLPPEAYYLETPRELIAAAVAIREEGREVDLETLAIELRKRRKLEAIGGMAGLAHYVEVTPACAQPRQHLDAIEGAWRRRQAIRAARLLAAEAATDAPLTDLLANHAASMRALIPWQARGPLAADWSTVPRPWLYEQPPGRQWLLHRPAEDGSRYPDTGVLPRGVVGLIAGAGGVSKSTAAIQLALLVASGSGAPWVGDLSVADDSRGGRVLLVLAEESPDEAWRRIYRCSQALSLSPEQRARVLGSLVVLARAGRDCSLLSVDVATRTVSRTALHADLLRRLEHDGPWALVVVDPLARAASTGAESSQDSATALISALEALSTTATGRPTILATHHTSQAARQAGASDATAARGVTGLTDGARWVATMVTAPGSLGRLVEFRVVKSNYSPPMPQPFLASRSAEHGGALVPVTGDEAAELAAAAAQESPEGRRARLRAAMGDRESNAMLEALVDAGETGLSRAQLDVHLCSLGMGLIERTLTRRLDGLIDCGKVLKDGPIGKGRRYVAAQWSTGPDGAPIADTSRTDRGQIADSVTDDPNPRDAGDGAAASRTPATAYMGANVRDVRDGYPVDIFGDIGES